MKMLEGGKGRNGLWITPDPLQRLALVNVESSACRRRPRRPNPTSLSPACLSLLPRSRERCCFSSTTRPRPRKTPPSSACSQRTRLTRRHDGSEDFGPLFAHSGLEARPNARCSQRRAEHGALACLATSPRPCAHPQPKLFRFYGWGRLVRLGKRAPCQKELEPAIFGRQVYRCLFSHRHPRRPEPRVRCIPTPVRVCRLQPGLSAWLRLQETLPAFGQQYIPLLIPFHLHCNYQHARCVSVCFRSVYKAKVIFVAPLFVLASCSHTYSFSSLAYCWLVPPFSLVSESKHHVST